MREVIQDWLGTRLGILLDMTPQKFARNTKDGTLLAKLLYNYGVIPVHVFEKVRESKNFYDCYNNLIVLKPWLNYIGVVHEDATLQNMARGEASAAVSIFYAVYLNLERRDRLYYLSSQKERRFSDVSCKFKVEWVPEREVMGDSFETRSKLAFDKNEMIDFHKAKCKEVVEIIKKTKQKFQKMFRKSQPTSGSFMLGQGNNLQPLDKRLKEAEETKETIKAFEKKHPEHSPNLTYSELIQLQNMQEAQPCLSIPNITKAKEIINNIKQRKKSEVYARNFQVEMQHMVLDDQWKIILEKQDKDFENVVCANLLKQSQYEKQMATKLALIRNQKKVLAENRKKIECLKIEQKVKEYEELMGARMEMRGEYWEDEEIEKERTAELHRRIYDERVRMRRKFLKEESQKICDALIDIAIRISDIRELTGCQVPKSFMKDMKELFFKDLSIFDILDDLEELYQKDSGIILGAVEGENGEEEEIIYRNEEYERMKNEEKIRQSVLNECDFFDYLNLLGPWMVELLFPDGSEMEVKQAVLGYVVHKILAVKYPAPNIPAPIPIKPMKPTAVVLGLADDASINMLLDLMELCKVLVVRVDDAINFVLATYKEEMSVVKDIDITFQKATANALKGKTNNGKEKEVKKKIQLLKKDSEKAMPMEESMNVIDKQTQTPRMIPEDDPLLSPNAELGKMAFEALGSGDPVPDSVIVSAVAAYVISKQENYNGWVLLNYPLLYPQASELECVLTGYRILPILDDVESIEDVEGFTYRESCVNPFRKNDFADRQISRLVPKPDVFAAPTEMPKSYFESFIVMKKMSDSVRWKSQDSISFGPMERFYSDQDILFNFEYSSLNFQSIKNLGKAILGEIYQSDDRDSLLAKNSLEIFGEYVLELNEKWDPSKKKNVKETATTKKVAKEPIKSELEEENSEEMVEVIKPPELPPTQAKPGDPDWEWATGRQPEHFLISLASLWENMEAVYIEDFKDVFFTLRVHHANVLSYSSFIRRTTRALMRRPDEKQRVLSDFHKMFNDIDEDLRPDVDIKCELHVRVSELEEALMQIADERKANSLNDLKKVGQDGWVADEMASLVNAYLTALQLEADRCINSCQVIMDYYITLQQKLPDEKPLNKVVVAKLQIKDRKYSIASSPSNKSNLLTPRNNEFKKSNKSLMDQVKSSHDRVSKTRSWMEKRKRSSDASFLTGAAEVITEILVSLSLPDDGLTPFHNFFIDSFQVVINEVKDTVEGCISESKRGDKALPKNPKKMSETKISVNGNLNVEWLTALENELSRFLFRVKLILARGIFEMNEFLTTILNILSSLAEDINEMYLKETHSISECCKVFRCGIEEEIGIQPYLELKEDEFIVDEENPLFSNHQEIVSIAVDEDQKFRFTIEQLSLICQKLQRVAPDGEIIKMSLLYILEDLRVLKSEVQNSNCFPDIWKMIEPDDLIYILNEIYRDLEIVHWKDFIIYAMDLPVPTEAEILHTRKSFRLFDPNVTELVSRENYDTVRFWFEATLDHYTQVDRNEKAKDLLYRMYQVDEHQSNYSALLLAFCKDDNPVLGFTKALALAMGKRINVVEYPEDLFPVGGENGEGDYLGLFDDVSSISIKKPDCCRVSFMESSRKCIPKEKIPTCDCQYFQKSLISEEEEEEEEEMSFSEKGGEGSFYFEHSLPNSMASTIPINILSSLLKASYQSLPQLSILLDCKQTFQETLNSIYDSLESHDGSVDVYKLIHHKFISRLLQTTNKFKFINIRHILMTVVEFKNSMGRTPCYLDKLNVNFCLN